MEAINASIDIDQRMASQDISGSRAHAKMLAQQGIISAEDAKAIDDGLSKVAEEIQHGLLTFKRELEDIHMNVEARLREIIGEPAGRLHTGRSRNDQVATDFRLWVRDSMDRVDAGLKALITALLDRAEAEAETILPGFTHLQPAQPVTLGHHLMAYVEMFSRDRGRFADARVRLNESPLGAAALAGTPYPLDREMTAAALNFDGPTRNSLDSVSSRDFALEYLAASSILAMHLSRMAEEMVVVVVCVLWLHHLYRRMVHGLIDHAAKAQPRRCRAVAGQDWPNLRRVHVAADDDEGAAAGVLQGYAGR